QQRLMSARRKTRARVQCCRGFDWIIGCMQYSGTSPENTGNVSGFALRVYASLPKRTGGRS
ncbi:MAG: hypothetical protein RM347_035030, partial [Nostoc sp. ChiQUE02]|uniref:hypothetical protein n=1 Tax=Nostoc sp. ChiQUE02 TaxID=3075377 RepID=UPI003D16228B